MKRFVSCLAVVATTAVLMVACANGAGRVRNAFIGTSHAAELDKCHDDAKASDAANQQELYERCRDEVNRRYGKDSAQ